MIDALKAFFVNHNFSILELTDCTHKKMQTIVSLCFICRSRTHKGVDIVCAVGSRVYAPFPASVVRGLTVYSVSKHRGKPYNTGLELRGTGAWTGNEPKEIKRKITKKI